MKPTKLHIEFPIGAIFGIGSAFCGAKRHIDSRMFPPDDKIHQLANRPFFADRIKQVTCLRCLELTIKYSEKHNNKKELRLLCLRLESLKRSNARTGVRR